MSETISDLIQTAEKEIRRDAEDLKRLKQRYPDFDFVRVDGETGKPAVSSVRPELSRVQAAVLGLIESSSFREWTSRSVLTELQAQRQASFPNDDAAMNAVSLALIALAEAGKITRTHQGRARDPHRYTQIQEVKNQEPA
jgi:hypothetical protein